MSVLKQTVAPQRPRMARPSEIEALLEADEDEGGFEPEAFDVDRPFDEQGAFDDPTAFEEALDEPADDARDTVQPPPPVDAFDDTTGRMEPHRRGGLSAPRHEREISTTTVPRAPAVPDLADLGWDEGEDLTDVSSLAEHERPRRR